MNIFITGTDTDVGKTIVTAGLAAVMQSLGYQTGIYKPVQTGCIVKNGSLVAPDLEFIKSIDPNIITKSTYNFKEPIAPALAAEMEGVKISRQAFVNDYNELRNKCEFVIVEGAGGILCPITNDFFIRDLAKLLDTPMVVVTKPNLGTVNHTLLTLQSARAAKIDVRGVIISNYDKNSEDISEKNAPWMISRYSNERILGTLPNVVDNGKLNPERLISEILKNLNLQMIFDIEIPKLM